LRIFTEMLAAHKEKGETTFSGADAFKLYDTYGFPIDLTLEMARDEGLIVDEAAFRQLRKEQKERAREARKALGDLGWADVEFGKEIPATEFVGYDQPSVEAKVLAIVAGGELRAEITSGADAIVVLDKTAFYAEMGGQTGDTGAVTAQGVRFRVDGTQKNKGGKFMHEGALEQGTLKVGDTVTATPDPDRRQAIRRAHSATHLLQSALQAVLGDHVHQAGSLVEPDRLRFDFTHFSAVTPEERREIENRVNGFVLAALPVTTEVLPTEEAKKRGATALFGEKYGDTVRVVTMGDASMELCGGTHVKNTAEVGLLRITSEASVASGVRRIEAVCGAELLKRMHAVEEKVEAAAELLKTTPAELLGKLESQIAEARELRQAMDKMKDKLLAGDVDRVMFGAHSVGDLHVVTATHGDTDANDLRKLGDFVRDRDDNVVAVLASVSGEKITLLAVCGKNAVAKGVRAGDIIRTIAPICGGKGGGKPDSAMGGGSDVLKLDDALAAVDDFVAGIVK
ncbi:MAG: alanine--tRNA ligase, partial [Oscillospiraceae bacterium]|nr:alanine--tRNA ligase [Oscillospiraceae bacterium]